MSSMIEDYASGAALLEGLHTFLTKGHTLPPASTVEFLVVDVGDIIST